MKVPNQNPDREQAGFMLIGVIILIALSLLITAGMVGARASESKIHSSMNRQAKDYYKVEETMSKTLAWLRAHSKYIITPFVNGDFATNFEFGTPSNGANDGAHFAVPTLVKMKGTNNSVMLSNNSYFGVSAFPSTTHFDTGASFDAVNAFETADLGEANVRVVLTWARETNGDYEPIFRVDVVNGNNPDRGVHIFSYVQTNLKSSAGVAFYAVGDMDLNTGNNQCYSFAYQYNSGSSSWNRGAQRSNCNIATDNSFSTKAKVHGSVYSKGPITLVNPSGEIAGDLCESEASCHAHSVAPHDDWDTVCGASNQGDLTINSDTTLTVASDAPADKCWGDVLVKSNKVLTLETTDFPYHFRNLTFQNNSNSNLAFADVPSDEKIVVYVENFADGSVNGNHVFNTNNAPHQIEINITGSGSLVLNGTAEINANIIAPLLNVELSGNFNFYGGIRAANISTIGNVRINADEALEGVPVISDLEFLKKKASQRYRLF